MFSTAKNVKDGKEFSEYYVSCNYGTVNPFSLGLWGRGADGWYRINEFYYSARDNGMQLTDEEYYEKLKELCGNRKITALIIDPSAASFIQTAKRHNEIPVVKANNRIREGIKRVSIELALHELFISPKCVNSIREFLTYSWNDENHLPEKKNDRTMDDIRFFVNTIVANHKSL
ncbi:MAG: hypothetical protein ACI37Z_05225 [Candidatus Gastranaerophilaceae bacterium]